MVWALQRSSRCARFEIGYEQQRRLLSFPAVGTVTHERGGRRKAPALSRTTTARASEAAAFLQLRASDVAAALAVLRIVTGIDMFVHGAGRFPLLASFAAGVTQSFIHSILPAPLVTAWAYVITFIEVLIGLCLTIGWGCD